jgi:hypothetical protein
MIRIGNNILYLTDQQMCFHVPPRFLESVLYCQNNLIQSILSANLTAVGDNYRVSTIKQQ